MTHEPVIGLETHVELATASKMFCGCPVSFGDEPNTAGCPVCLGLPGALPVPNEAAIDAILRIGLALNCRVNPWSVFHRKNYFYPDLPKNYQISQYDEPVCSEGWFEVDVGEGTSRIGITRVHMEEDTGKSLHVGVGGRIHAADYSLLDFNRSGVPLVEVVTEPDIRSAAEARSYAVELQELVRSLGVSDARLEEGSMRFDANISLRPAGSSKYGTRAEIKNMNSLRSLHDAIQFEIDRQAAVLDGGGVVVQETRHWNEEDGTTRPMRSKEESEDYRYFQEPDLVPLSFDEEWVERVRASLPELPRARKRRYRDMGADDLAARLLTVTPALGALFEDAHAAGADAARVVNWITGEGVAHARRGGIAVADTALTGAHLVELDRMVADGLVSATAAKEILGAVMDGEGSPGDVAAAHDLAQMTDRGAIEAEVDAVLAANADAVAKIRDGDMKPLGFLVGQVMRATGGKADPRAVSDLVRSKAQA